MTWFLFALISPILWATCNCIDKYFLDQYVGEQSPVVLVIFTGLAGGVISLVLFLIHPFGLMIAPSYAAIIMGSGFLFVASFIPYIIALKYDDASNVVPLYQLIPVFGYLMGLVFLHESLALVQLLGGVLIIAGSVIISFDPRRVLLKQRTLFLMAASSFGLALVWFLFKVVAIDAGFLATAFWEYLGAFLFALFALGLFKKTRQQFLSFVSRNKTPLVTLGFGSEILNIVAKLSSSFASLLAPLALVLFVNGLQPAIIFILGLGLTIFFPSIMKEDISRRVLIRKSIAIAVIILGTYFLLR